MHGLIGVVHLPALPGDPAHPSLERALAAARRDASALAEGGATGIIVENFGSTPFHKGTAGDRLPPHQVALMTRAALSVREVSDLPLGINCLRNDAQAALAVAVAVGANAIRVNVHSGAYVTDQGIIEGEAAHTLRTRTALGIESVQILADVLVKHAAPLAPIRPADATRDVLMRGRADAVIVTGHATGGSIDLETLAEIHDAAGEHPLLLGSGVTPQNAAELGAMAHGAIVGTWLKEGGRIDAPVDAARVRALRDALLPSLRGERAPA